MLAFYVIKEREFIDKDKTGGFYNNQDRITEKEKLDNLKAQVPAAQKTIDNIKKKSVGNSALSKIVEKFESEILPVPVQPNINIAGNQKQGRKEFVKDKLSKDGRRVLRKVFEVINSTSILDENQAKLLCDAIVKKFA